MTCYFKRKKTIKNLKTNKNTDKKLMFTTFFYRIADNLQRSGKHAHDIKQYL